VEIVEGAAAELRVTRAMLAPGEGPPAPLVLAPSGTLLVENPGEGESHAKLERVTWSDQAAKARVVMTMPGFRRDFSGDILRPGMALKVARVGVFFSDLTGSTQLYADAGDAAAFKLVHDHFEIVIGLIEKSGGSLVKTIGDAVMAAFADDLDGLVASVAILHAFEDFRVQGEHRGRTHIKLGVYGGPCYAVTANEVLDYFGQTVNLAARLQAEAHAGELVVPAELCDRALAARAIPASFVRERYEARLKGVPNPLAVARIKVGR
jgi:class 3 adenylate cyclase